MAVLWDLVSGRNLDPVGAGMRGYQAGDQIARERQKRSVLAELAGQGGDLNYDQAAQRLLAVDPNAASTLAQLGMRKDDQNFRRETRAEDMDWRRQQAEQSQKQWAASHGLQRENANFQRQLATRPEITFVENEMGVKTPYAVNRMTGEVRPLMGGGQPQGGVPGAAPPVGQFSGSTNDAFAGQPQPRQQGSIPPPPPGVDAATWRKEQTKRLIAQQGAGNQKTTAANVVVQDIDRALGIIKESPTLTTGMVGQGLSNVGGTSARDLSALLGTVKANSGFDRLQQMREASPTGGALGQVSNIELGLLTSAIGSLEQSQSPEQLQDNLRRVKNIYLDIIHGRDQGPEREALKFQQDGGWQDVGGGVKIRRKQ